MSEGTKRIGLIELTVPSKERIEVSGELKRAKYAPLQEEGKKPMAGMSDCWQSRLDVKDFQQLQWPLSSMI